MSITQNQRDAITGAMKLAAQQIASKLGLALDFDFEVGTYAYNVAIEAKFSVKDQVGQAVSHERRMFEHLASRYGLAPSDFGKTFWMKGTQYKITGINQSAPRYAITGERVRDGKGFRFPARDVANCLSKVASAA